MININPGGPCPARNTHRWLQACVLTVALFGLGAKAEPAFPTTPGALAVERPDGVLLEMPLEHTSVQVEISAFVARTRIEQTFSNPLDEPVEAVYTFPLGHRAAVDEFELVVGDRVIRGEIHRREEARQIYATAREEGRQAALLEQERPNIFTQSVANLEPGAPIRVRIQTVETLPYEAGTYRWNFPLVVGPRFTPGRRAVPDAERITPPVMAPGVRSGHDVDIVVSLDAGVPIAEISSPSHDVRIDRPTPSSSRVRLEPADSLPNKDFMLRWSVSSEVPAVGLLAHRTAVDGFFTLLVQPKAAVGIEEAMPKEVVLVLDTSGSMSGVPLEASKRFVKRALRTLGPRDTFNLIGFASGARTFSEAPLPNEPDALRRALEFVDGLSGAGGTRMLAGLRAAFSRGADPDRLRLVIFLTDGYIGNEDQILAGIGEVVDRARIYTVGIGNSVNHYLLDRMAGLGHGAYVFVRPDGGQDEALERFHGWVSLPYLTDIEIDWGALPVVDVLPRRPRDLFSGQTLNVVGRFVGEGRGEIAVRGRLGGSYWERRLEVELPHRRESNAGLAAVWARERIDGLLLSVPGRVTPPVEAAVTALALEYRLLSPFTSFVAVDDSRVANPGGESRTVHQAVPMPEGVSFEAIFGTQGPAALRVERPVAGDARHELAEESRRVASIGQRLSTPPKRKVARTRTAVAYDRAASSAPLDVMQTYASLGMVGPPIPSESARQAGPEGAADAFRVDHPAGESVSDDELLLEISLRVLADLAEDGRLSPAEGVPSLAALLVAQAPGGGFSAETRLNAIAAWALAEAAAALPGSAWVHDAAATARSHLVDSAGPQARSPLDEETTRWCRLILSRIEPQDAPGSRRTRRADSEALLGLLEAWVSTAIPDSAAQAALERLVAARGA